MKNNDYIKRNLQILHWERNPNVHISQPIEIERKTRNEYEPMHLFYVEIRLAIDFYCFLVLKL